MKIALLQPHVPDLNTTPPLGPLYLAAVLEQAGFEVFLFDERIEKDVIRKIISFAPDLIGITAVTSAYLRGLAVANEIKTRFPAIKVVFGGPHPTALPEAVLAESIVDYVIIGEGEHALLSLCQAVRDRDESDHRLRMLKNIVYRGSAGELHLPETKFLCDAELDHLPYAAFYLMNLENYFKGSQLHGIYQKGLRVLPIMTARGCPSRCTFCCRVMGNKIRKRSIDNVAAEIEYLLGKYHIDELYIEDDNFTIDKQRALSIMDIIKKSKLKYLKFANGVNVNQVDEELLAKMKEAKVYSVSFGIESGCSATLQKMNKHIDLVRARELILYAKSLGLLVGANCIIGYPGETQNDIRVSREYFSRLPLDSMAIVNLVPFPGTRVRQICEEKGYLTPQAKNWNNYFFSINNPIPLVSTPTLSSQELIKEVKNAYRKMYFNIFWVLKAVKNLSLNKIWMGIKIYFGRC